MKKTLIWVGALVVVVVVVILVAGGGGPKEEKPRDRSEGVEITAMDLQEGEMLYELIERDVGRIESAFGLQDMLMHMQQMTLVGYAWVSSVQDAGGGKWQVELDVDPPDQKRGGAEITATTDAGVAQAEPTVGQKVGMEGQIRLVDISGDRPRVFIDRAKLTAVTAK